MKKMGIIIIIALIFIALPLAFYIWRSTAQAPVENSSEEYPKIAYIDDVTYYGSEEICEMVPRRMPDGVIETFVNSAIMPDSYNSANFGADQESLEYMFLDDGQLIIKIGEEWYYFEQASE